MSHLQPSEFIEMLDGTLAAERVEHARECQRCRQEAASLTETMGQITATPTPEPSPLFWGRFSARVREGIDRVEPDGDGWWVRWVSGPAVAAAIAVALAVGGLAWYVSLNDSPATVTTSHAPTSNQPAAQPPPAPLDDEAWTMVVEAAEDLSWEEGAVPDALAVGPGAAERAVAEMSDQQREELATLLRAEIERTKS
jgi:hypothetical protein